MNKFQSYLDEFVAVMEGSGLKNTNELLKYPNLFLRLKDSPESISINYHKFDQVHTVKYNAFDGLNKKYSPIEVIIDNKNNETMINLRRLDDEVVPGYEKVNGETN